MKWETKPPTNTSEYRPRDCETNLAPKAAH